MDRGAWWATVYRVTKSQTQVKQLSTYAFLFYIRRTKAEAETSLVAQWLSLHAFSAGGSGLIPGQGTRSHMLQLKPSIAK